MMGFPGDRCSTLGKTAEELGMLAMNSCHFSMFMMLKDSGILINSPKQIPNERHNNM